MATEDLDHRLAALETRLAQLEAKLTPPPAPSPPLPPPLSPPEFPDLIPDEPPAAAIATEPVIPIVEPLSNTWIEKLEPVRESWFAAGLESGNGKSAGSKRATETIRPLDAQLTLPHRGGLEEAIGLQWAGWIGAITLVIGCALAIKFIYDQGWWGHLAPPLRLTIMSSAGVALLIAGEWVYRKINIIASTGLFGAGIAMFILVSYAGCEYYQLYTRNLALLFMVFSTLIGAATSLRGNLPSIAVLALLGGYIAPALLTTDHLQLAPFLAYLLMLQIVALLLAARRIDEIKWRVLRPFALIATSIWIAAVLIHGPINNPPLFLGFMILFALLYHAELFLFTARATIGGAALAGLYAIAVSAAFIAAVLTAEHSAPTRIQGAWVLATSALVTAFAAFLGRQRVSARYRSLAASYWLQAAALLVLAVPVMTRDINIPLAWGIMALLFAIYGSIAKTILPRAFAVFAWILALLALLHFRGPDPFADWNRRDSITWLHFTGLTIGDATITTWLLALIGHAIASLNAHHQPNSDRPSESLIWLPRLTSLADIVWIIASIVGLTQIDATLSIILLAWLLAAADTLDHRPHWALHSLVILFFVTLKWAVVDMLSGFWDVPTSILWAAHYRPILNPLLGTGALLCASIILEFWLLRARLWDIFSRWLGLYIDARRALIFSALVITTIATFALTCEITRTVNLLVDHNAQTIWPPAQLIQLAWTALWTIALAAFVAFALFIETPDRNFHWIRLTARFTYVLTGKFILIDTFWFRVLEGSTPAMLALNLQTITALILTLGLATAWFVAHQPDNLDYRDIHLEFAALFLGFLVLLWCGTLEIDRAFENYAPLIAMRAQLTKQVAWSIYWSLFAIISVTIGFRFRRHVFRYFGLGLFALTILKVMIIDLSQVGRGYRIFSFVALGLLLLTTSVLYGKLTPQLLHKETSD